MYIYKPYLVCHLRYHQPHPWRWTPHLLLWPCLRLPFHALCSPSSRLWMAKANLVWEFPSIANAKLGRRIFLPFIFLCKPRSRISFHGQLTFLDLKFWFLHSMAYISPFMAILTFDLCRWVFSSCIFVKLIGLFTMFRSFICSRCFFNQIYCVFSSFIFIKFVYLYFYFVISECNMYLVVRVISISIFNSVCSY